MQRYILVHSYLYYEYDTSVISDKQFDDSAKQLVAMQSKNPDDAERSQYWYVFYNFDGSTGFDLFDRLTKTDKKKIKQISHTVLKLYKGRK